MEENRMTLLHLVAQTIFDKKGVNILALDLRPCPTFADYTIIAEGLADVHVKSIADAVLKALELKGIVPDFKEGMQEGDWVVLDFSWLTVHLFKPGFRDKYALETLWAEAEIVDVMIQVPSAQAFS